MPFRPWTALRRLEKGENGGISDIFRFERNIYVLVSLLCQEDLGVDTCTTVRGELVQLRNAGRRQTSWSMSKHQLTINQTLINNLNCFKL